MSIIKNKLFQILFIFAALATVSCTKQLNTNLSNPNGVGINTISGKDVFAQALLSTVTNKIGANISTASDNYDYAQEWMGFWARNSGWAASGEPARIETYALINSDANGVWQSVYHNIYDYNFVIGNSSANSILPGAATVIRAMLFQDLVDQFGNIPFSQACQPLVSITPAYDSATTIYKRLVAQVDSAITMINSSQSTADDASDIMFSGNKSKWLAFANTIKLRLLLRQVPNVYAPSSAYIAAELSNVASQGGFIGAGQDATINPGFVDVSNQQNPFWGVYGFQPNGGSAYQNNSFFCANAVMFDTLQATSDPRLGYFYGNVPGQPGVYLANPLGSTPNAASPIGPGVLQSPEMPALLLSASQSLFMQAEAAQRGMITGNYTSLFQTAVEESFRYLAISNYKTVADNFITGSADPFVNINISSNPLATILGQKWVAECGLDGLEAYNDYRRTGYPVIYGTFSGANIPQERLLYPESEYTQNQINVNAQGQAALGQAAATVPIFWAQ
jgi:hypothetical protein